MRLTKKSLSFICINIILLLLSNTCFAVYQTSPQRFSDVPTDHWAFNAVTWMANNHIISGYPNGTFKPNDPITRAEFAAIMVVALKLNLKDTDKNTFKDVSKDDWSYKYVETAKYYLTGFRTSTGDLFKPSDMAVREDMAVALVKAKNLGNEVVNLDILNVYTDKEAISPNLKNFVAIAVKHEFMKGSKLSGSEMSSFNPQSTLTRAEAAVLLYNVVKDSEEKVTYTDDTKTTPSQPQMNDERAATHYIAPIVTGSIEDGKIIIRWNKIVDSRFKYYKVVVSQKNPYPRYPDDGYLYYFTDNNVTSAVIDNSEVYNSGDFGKYLVSGQKYYFSVTAVYEDIKLPGNAISLVYPAKAENPNSKYAVPEVKAEIIGNKVLVNWKEITNSSLNGYKIILSKNNPTPKYPDDGYLQWITDKHTTSWDIKAGDSYNRGDFGGRIKSGETYYLSITALYDNMNTKIPGNVVKITIP